jgi:hypothetical protein
MQCGLVKFPPLPKPSSPVPFPATKPFFGAPWSVEALVWALVNVKSFSTIQDWLTSAPKASVQKALKAYEGISPLFYAAARNCPQSIHLLTSSGLDPNVTAFKDNIPVLAYGIMHSWINMNNGTDVVKTLVSLEAAAKVIPPDMWSDYVAKLRSEAPPGTLRTSDDHWCHQVYRNILALALNFTMRYFLSVRSELSLTGNRQMAIAEFYNMKQLFTIPYHLVGQQDASRKILTALWGKLCTINKEKPLVSLFAGPSGHGKTELTRNLGGLLNVKQCLIDCTKLVNETDLFGTSMGYRGNEEGSKLNNFLVANSGVRSVVFMDEYVEQPNLSTTRC